MEENDKTEDTTLPSDYSVDLTDHQGDLLAKVLGDLSKPIAFSVLQERLWKYLLENNALRNNENVDDDTSLSE